MLKIDIKNSEDPITHYKELNSRIRKAVDDKEELIVLENINGERFIGANLEGETKIKIHGVPGNDLAFTMQGLEIEVFANGQDAIGNTMSSGKLIIHGNAGDICGYAMRGGKIFIKESVGYRSGIHMKEYGDSFPIIMIGEKGGDFLGEYMAGGLIVVLGLMNDGKPKDEQISPVGYLTGTGMHGGNIFFRGEVEEWKLGKEVKIKDLDPDEKELLQSLIDEFSNDFKMDLSHVKVDDFRKMYPGSKRPYGNLYAY